MYDDLIKQLRYCADATTCRHCPWKTECCPTDMQKKAADAIEELQKRVPKRPHGRLIDAGAFIAEQRHLYCENCERRKGMKNGKVKFVYDIGDAPCRACGYGDVLDDLEDAPTIIEAEGDEK